MPGWVTGGGEHPTKLEAYSPYNTVPPWPMTIFFNDVLVTSADMTGGALLAADAPYTVQGALTNFSAGWLGK